MTDAEQHWLTYGIFLPGANSVTAIVARGQISPDPPVSDTVERAVSPASADPKRAVRRQGSERLGSGLLFAISGMPCRVSPETNATSPMVLGGNASMARPLRVEYAGACYHVMNRGNLGATVFASVEDHELFLAKLAQQAASYAVEVRAYCLMGNHFHLYLRTCEPNLSAFMQSFLTAFTVSHNRRHRRAGHLFQGRYKALLVEDDAYGSEVTRYIHLNRGRLASLADADFEARRQAVRQYPWSSYGALIGLRSCPEWLARESLLANWGNDLRQRQAAYAAYVEQGLTSDEVWDPAQMAVAQAVVGRDDFVDRVRRGLAELPAKLSLRRACGQAARLRTWLSVEELLSRVAAAYAVAPASIVRRYRRGNEARQVLLYLACRHCRGRYTLTELGERLGPITVGALSRAAVIMAERLRRDRALRSRVDPLEKDLLENCK